MREGKVGSILIDQMAKRDKRKFVPSVMQDSVMLSYNKVELLI